MQMSKEELQAELDRIKEGIKRNDLTMCVDGGDMADWGWMRRIDHNREIYELTRRYNERR